MREARVLHVVASQARRGAEVFAVDLADALLAHGWPGRVVAVEPGPHADLAVPSVAPRWPSAQALRALRAAARHVDVVVAHGSTSLPAMALALVGAPTPFMYRTIGDPAYWTPSPVARAWVGVALRRAAVVVALWPAARDELLRRHRLARERVVVLPTAVDVARFRPADDERRRRCRLAFGVPTDAHPVVAVVAALSPEKEVGLALAALAHLPDEAFLLVAGDGAERAALEASAPAGRVRFLGSVDGVPDVLAAADVLALTSRTEGLPAVAIEAVLAGVPVVASPVGAVPEIVTPGNGVLLGSRHAGDVATAILAALTLRPDPEPVRARFGVDAVAAGWARMLSDVVRRGG
jgi:glycosyltransferase involved in cell wall biosynthesis